MNAILTEDRRVTIGFEAPLFIPEPEDPSLLCRGRYGDRDRSCFASPAAAVAMLCLHQAAWLLENLRDIPVRLVWSYEQWLAEPSLLIWEAFVSGGAKPTHRRIQHKKIVSGCRQCSMADAHDAATAADAFLSLMDANGRIVACIHAERPLSLIGAAVLWSGWALKTDVQADNLLRQQVIVLRPEVSVVDHSPDRIETFTTISEAR
jgi:hypothetical protein